MHPCGEVGDGEAEPGEIDSCQGRDVVGDVTAAQDRAHGPGDLLGDLVAVLSAGTAERSPHQVNDAGLDDALGPDLTDRVGQALQPGTDQHEDVLDAPVLQLGRDPEPVLGALATLPSGPLAEDAAVAFGGDREGCADGRLANQPPRTSTLMRR